MRYVPFDGGGEALTALLGGFVQAFAGDASEVRGQLEAGTVRVLATLSDKRLAGPYQRVPTAKELGYDVSWVVWRGFYVGKEMPGRLTLSGARLCSASPDPPNGPVSSPRTPLSPWFR